MTYGDGTTVWQEKKTGKWACEFRYRLPNGKLRRIQRRHASKREAQEGARQLRLENENSYKPDRPITVDVLIEKYCAYKLNEIRAHTVANSKYLLLKYVEPYFKGRLVHKLTTSDVMSLMVSLREQGLRTSSINTVKGRLSGMLSFALQIDLVKENVALRVKNFRAMATETTLKQEPWSLEEAKSALLAFSNSPIDLFIHVSVTLGLRKGETLALKWGDVDFAKGEIFVHKSRGERRLIDEHGKVVTRVVEHETKTKSSVRKLGIPALLALAFMREKKRLEQRGLSALPDQYIILGEQGFPLSYAVLTRSYNKVCRDFEIRRIRIHDHRHTAIIISIESGALIDGASQGAGHSSLDITKRLYAPYVASLADRYSTAMGEAFGVEAMEPDPLGALTGGGANV